MAHVLPPRPGRRRSRFPVATVVLVVVAFAVGLFVGTRHSRSNSDPITRSTLSPTAADRAGLTTPSATAPPTSPSPTTTPGPKTAAPTTTTPKTKSPSVPKVGIVVANNTGRNGLAATARSRFEDKGWKVTDVTNFSGGVVSTCAYYSASNPAYKRAAELLRKEFPAIKRIKPRFSRLPSSPIVVILTRDYH